MAEKVKRAKSAHPATAHFWRQRLTAIVLIPLSFWALVLFNKSLNAPYADTVAWLKIPMNVGAIIAWTLAVMYHAALGVQVVIEDYVSTIPVRRWAIRGCYLIFSILGIAALSAIVLILFPR